MHNSPDTYHVELVWEYYTDTEQRSVDHTFYLIAKNNGKHQWCQELHRKTTYKALALRGIPLVNCKEILENVKNLPTKKRKIVTEVIWKIVD
jgi:hypothetical protein